ncbi:hypothetical protein FDG95_gp552 [Pectobacterium phage vB_PcaM_CBB]|uniref:Uncharacterized protein n=1 Tax=Pectobacterium phage vB_PcaM_CBB TaxID=2772511 RepID=A0A1L2CVC6_9CAUD|nr:hypothetical protein FDG95_gp552 [Pectobacterium phage vB_PcaM_CBB]AMM43990.1 hypothetical protein CBB_427 [Pectobacterium phage vB_PcaM_CBB]
MKTLNKLILGVAIAAALVSTANAERMRPARYIAECSTPKGVYEEKVYDYDYYNGSSIKVTPLLGKQILFVNAFCVFYPLEN